MTPLIALFVQTAAPATGESARGPGLGPFIFQIAAIFAIFYFLMIRPQQKQRKAHEASILALKKGDQVVTAGGVVGEVIHIKEGLKAGARPKRPHHDQERRSAAGGHARTHRLHRRWDHERLMAVLPITVLGAPILRQETVPVGADGFTDKLRQLSADMFETMRAANGIGLAAPQVGRTERICVVEVNDESHTLVNPEIIEREGKIKWEEGCLSIPEVFGWVQRSEWVKVRALDLQGQPFEVEGSELMAVCLQHEIDHLDGKLFLDHLSFLKRRQALAVWDEEKTKYPGMLRVLQPGDTDLPKTAEQPKAQR